MKAMAVHTPAPIETNPLSAIEVPAPEPGAGEILVRVLTCGVCRTDLHVAEGDLPPRLPRVIPGHEVVGVVERCGDGCKRLKIGDRVGIAWLRETCGACVYCRRERENLCPNARFTGYDHDGGYAEAAVVREEFTYPIPSLARGRGSCAAALRGDHRLPCDQTRRGPAGLDRRTVRLRRLGPYRDPGAAPLGMPRAGDEPRRQASRAGREPRRVLGRRGARAASKAARRGDFVRAGRRSRRCPRWKLSIEVEFSRSPEST